MARALDEGAKDTIRAVIAIDKDGKEGIVSCGMPGFQLPMVYSGSKPEILNGILENARQLKRDEPHLRFVWRTFKQTEEIEIV